MWWLSKPMCGTCPTKLPTRAEPYAQVRMNSTDGPIELTICDACADFFDQSADVLRQKPRRTND